MENIARMRSDLSDFVLAHIDSHGKHMVTEEKSSATIRTPFGDTFVFLYTAVAVAVEANLKGELVVSTYLVTNPSVFSNLLQNISNGESTLSIGAVKQLLVE